MLDEGPSPEAMMRRHMLMPMPAPMILLTLALPTAWCVAAGEQERIFDDIYGARVKATIATLDKTDDHALAQEFTRQASDTTTNDALALVLFNHAYDLAIRDPSGAGLAAQAMEAMASRLPAHRSIASEKRIDALNQVLLRGKAEEREAAGEQMIDLLLETGDAQASAGKFTESLATYRRAAAATARVKSRSADEIRPRIEQVTQLARAAQQVELYRTKLLENRNDTATGEALVKLYLTELDDPAAAAAYLDVVKDEAMKKAATLAAKPISELSEAEAMTLAQWYFTQSQNAKGLAEGVTLSRAKMGLDQFLARHQESGLAKAKASAMLAEVNRRSATAALGPVKSSSKVRPPSQSILESAVVVYSFEKKTITGSAENSTVSDLSSKSTHGKIYGAQSVAGIAGDAMELDGKDDWIHLQGLEEHLGNNVKEFTIVSWYKKGSATNSGMLFDIGFHADHSISVLMSGRVHFYFMHGKTPSNSIRSTAPFDSKWHHLTVVWDGKSRIMYIDGKLDASNDCLPGVITKQSLHMDWDGASEARIGTQAKKWQREERHFKGLIDEFAILTRALSNKEVIQLYEAGKAGIHFGQYGK